MSRAGVSERPADPRERGPQSDDPYRGPRSQQRPRPARAVPDPPPREYAPPRQPPTQPRSQPQAERRTIVIQGRGAERYRSTSERRRPSQRRHERAGFRPDRAAMWAVLLGVVMILVAATSSHAAVLHRAPPLTAAAHAPSVAPAPAPAQARRPG